MNQQRVRETAIDTILSNLAMAGVLLPNEVADMMAKLIHLNDFALSNQMDVSKSLFKSYLFNRPRN